MKSIEPTFPDGGVIHPHRALDHRFLRTITLLYCLFWESGIDNRTIRVWQEYIISYDGILKFYVYTCVWLSVGNFMGNILSFRSFFFGTV